MRNSLQKISFYKIVKIFHLDKITHRSDTNASIQIKTTFFFFLNTFRDEYHKYFHNLLKFLIILKISIFYSNLNQIQLQLELPLEAKVCEKSVINYPCFHAKFSLFENRTDIFDIKNISKSSK